MVKVEKYLQDLLHVTKIELAYISVHVQWHLGNHLVNAHFWYGYQKYKLIQKAVELLKNCPVHLIKIKCHRSPAVGKMLSDHFCIVLMLFPNHPAQDIEKGVDINELLQ